MKKPKEITFYDDDGEEHSIECVWEVCDRCKGEGSHTNPNVDGHGISPQEFQEDPEFARNYFAGVYDVECYKCKGLRVVQGVDLNQLEPNIRKKYEAYLKEERQYQQMCDYERRMGA